MFSKLKQSPSFKKHSHSFLTASPLTTSYTPLFPEDPPSTNSSLSTLISLLSKKTPCTSHPVTDHSFSYKPDPSPFQLNDSKHSKKTSMIYGNVSILSCPSLIPEKVFLLPKYSIHNKYSKNVLEFSYQEDQNVSFKKSMEDKAKTISNFNSNPHNILFTLFDGHGGDIVSSYLQQHFDKFLKQSLATCNNNISKGIEDAFAQMDSALQSLNAVRMGSTGCILYITQEKGKKVMYCANIGDTRCTFFTASTVQRLSYDHRAEDLSERERIYSKGGYVVNGRVNGRLMLSRTFGDFELKKVGVVAEPYVCRKEVDEEGSGVVVMACDGIWDVLNEEGIRECIVNVCNDKENLKKNVTATVCEELIRSALEEGAWDNLSVFAIKL